MGCLYSSDTVGKPLHNTTHCQGGPGANTDSVLWGHNKRGEAIVEYGTGWSSETMVAHKRQHCQWGLCGRERVTGLSLGFRLERIKGSCHQTPLPL